MRTESYGDPAMEELATAPDSDELCRLLVQSPWGWGWGSSTHHGEAISLLRGLGRVFDETEQVLQQLW